MQILVTDPKKRLSLEQIEADPWMGGDGTSSGAAAASLTGDTKSAAGVAHLPSAQDMAEAIKDGVEEDESKDDGGMRKLNAFEIVAMFGGMNLNNIIVATTERHVHRPPQFISDKSQDEIMGKVKSALAELEFSPEVDASGSAIAAHKLTSHGEVTMSVRLSSLSDTFHVVTIVRGRGDLMEYSKAYDRLVGACSDLVYHHAA